MMTRRYARPAIGWTITRKKEPPHYFAPMRITSINRATFTVEGGVSGIGTRRKIEDVFGRFPNAFEADKACAVLNRVIQVHQMKLDQIADRMAQLEAERRAMIDELNTKLREFCDALPTECEIDDAYAR